MVTPNYNYERYLEETIRSVLLQGYPNLQYVVVDDSDDRSCEIIERYSEWLVLPPPAVRKGQTAALNRGFAVAEGSVLSWLNSDDTYEPSAIAAAAEAITPTRQVVFAECRFIDEDGQTIWEPGELRSRAPLTLRDWVKCWKTYPAAQPSVFWHRAVSDTVGPLDESFHYALDYEFFLRVAERFPFHHVPTILSNFRIHGHSKTVSQRDLFLPEIWRASARYWGSARRWRYWRTALSAWIWLYSIRRAREAIELSRAQRYEALRRLAVSFLAWPFGVFVAPRVVLAALYRTVFGWGRAARSIRKILPRLR